MKTNSIFITVLVVLLSCPFVACAQKKESKKSPVEVKSDTLAVLTEKALTGDAVAQNTLGNWYYKGNNVKQDYKKALEWWAKSADQGNAYAIGNMALCYQLGQGVHKDSVMAMKLYKTSVIKGNKEILNQHGKFAEKKENIFSNMLMYELYNTGTGVKHDAAKAAYYLEHLAEMGDAEHQYHLALYYLNNNQADMSYKWFKSASAKGIVGATYYCGYLLHQGMGVSQDKTEGIRLMQRSEEQGFIAAGSHLGRLFYEGDGVERDYTKAVGYLLKAAPNNGNAQWLLGLCYLNGYGIPQNYYFAAQWLAEAAVAHEKEFNDLLWKDNGGTFSQYLMGLKHYYINKDFDAAINCFKIVEKAGIAEGKTMQAVCMSNKDYAKRNTKKAAKLLTKVTSSSPAANYYLSTMYENGLGVKKDMSKAIELLEKAATDGVAYAQCRLGDRYMTGDGVTKDFVKAAQLYIQAENQHHLTSESAKNLAQCYIKRISVLSDLNNSEKRIESLKSHKDNTRLISLLKKLSK